MSPFALLVKFMFTQDDFDTFEERAAILQFDAKLPIEAAEVAAYKEVLATKPKINRITIDEETRAAFKSTLAAADYTLAFVDPVSKQTASLLA